MNQDGKDPRLNSLATHVKPWRRYEIVVRERIKKLLNLQNLVFVILLSLVILLVLMAQVKGITITKLVPLVVYGAISGSIITLGAIGLSLTYGILRFAHFAHGDVMAFGAYVAFTFMNLFQILGVPERRFGPLSFGLPLALAFPIAMILTASMSVLIDQVLYKRLRRSRPVILLIASVGVALMLRNIIQLIWGPWPLYYKKGIQLAIIVAPIGIKIKPDQVFIIAIALLLVVLIYLFLQKTKMGKAMRATSDNRDLAQVTGIDTERVVIWTWGIGAALAAAAGILIGIDMQLQPDMGWNVLLSIFAAVILGGIGNPYGAMAGGLIIGLSEEISTAFISTGYKPAVAFIIMIMMLLIKPKGLFGGKT